MCLHMNVPLRGQRSGLSDSGNRMLPHKVAEGSMAGTVALPSVADPGQLG